MDTDHDWMQDANCKGQGHLFYPLDAEGQVGMTAEAHANIQQAKALCAKCPVRELCLDYAIRNDEKHGIWGGMNRRERVAFAMTGEEQLTLG